MSIERRATQTVGTVYRHVLDEGRFNAATIGDSQFLVFGPPERRNTVVLQEGQPIAFSSHVTRSEGVQVKERAWHVFIQPTPKEPVAYLAYRINYEDGSEMLALGFVGNIGEFFQNQKGEKPKGRGASYDAQTGELIEPFHTWEFPLNPNFPSLGETELRSTFQPIISRKSAIIIGTWTAPNKLYQETVIIPPELKDARALRDLLRKEESSTNLDACITLFRELGIKLKSKSQDTSIKSHNGKLAKVREN